MIRLPLCMTVLFAGRTKASRYQDEICHLPEHRRVCVRGPHGLGKTALISWQTLWLRLHETVKIGKVRQPRPLNSYRSSYGRKSIMGTGLKWAKLTDNIPDKPELLDLSLNVHREAFALGLTTVR